MITKGFYKRWIGLDSEKDTIHDIFPNQVRDTDTYYAEDTNNYYFRWHNKWNHINKDTENINSSEELIEELIYNDIENNQWVEFIANESKIKELKELYCFYKPENYYIPILDIQKDDKFFNSKYTKIKIEKQNLNIFVVNNEITIKFDNYTENFIIQKIDEEEEHLILYLNKPIDNKDFMNSKNVEIIHSYTLSLFDILILADDLIIGNEQDYLLFSTNLNQTLNVRENLLSINDSNLLKYCDNKFTPILLNYDQYFIEKIHDNKLLLLHQTKKNYDINTNINTIFNIKQTCSNINNLKIYIKNKSGFKRTFITKIKYLK